MKCFYKEELIGTAYIELSKGKYMNKMHNESIYFKENDFQVYEMIFSKFNPKYRPFSYTNFDSKTSNLIILELEKFVDIISVNGNVVDALKDMNYDIYVLGNSSIDNIESTVINEVISTTNKLIEWLKNTMHNNNCFSVVGL